ncbi:hypothetical protein DEA8626_01262 [Defluviimonas aquaemixtae]|uniref:Inner membrane protein YdcZ n=1 Tax=Albidovulum aquaemixtae TaxID=1542388 RepID=A0A2R8B562_9RHOB|nr:DMT family transporter [Defluviimonas aquaemixtae]SPH17735.1 hypothetical protein DEA8626_01262 [Defluviimonas aquaemixtae]
MTAETMRYGAIMILAGIGIPVLAALNAQLGHRLASPPAAALVLFAVAFCGTALVVVLTSGFSPLAEAPGEPKHLFLAGLLVAFYVLSITWVAPRFGIGNAITCVLLGQLLSAALIDQFGLMGAIVRQVTPARALGLCLMAAGVVLAQRG